MSVLELGSFRRLQNILLLDFLPGRRAEDRSLKELFSADFLERIILFAVIRLLDGVSDTCQFSTMRRTLPH